MSALDSGPNMILGPLSSALGSHAGQSKPDSGLCLQVKVSKPLQVVLSWLGSGTPKPGLACSLEKPPDLDPFDLTRAVSAKELKEHPERRVL